MHSGTLWNILHIFWNILEHSENSDGQGQKKPLSKLCIIENSLVISIIIIIIMSIIFYIFCYCGQIQSADWTETPGLGPPVDAGTQSGENKLTLLSVLCE